MRILLAEDDDYMRSKYAAILRNEGFIVEVAPDGQEACDLLSGRKYDAVITDMQMPHVTGYGVIMAIWSRELKIPCLLHSHARMHQIGKDQRDLSQLQDEYPFVTFTIKHMEIEKIKLCFLEFLSKAIKA